MTTTRLWSAILPFLIIPTISRADDRELPSFKSLRYDEDYQSLRGSPLLDSAWGRMKYVEVGDPGGTYLSFGGEIREMVEGYRNEFFSTADDADSIYLLQRFLLHMDLHVGDRFRLFTQLQSSFENGKTGDSDVNRLDLHQFFADLAFPLNGDSSLTVRGGRQELSFGSERLIGVREGTNNRRAFDAGRIIIASDDWNLDLFAGSPVEWDQGIFDDQAIDDVWLWGLYGTLPLSFPVGAKLDAYYIGLHKPSATFSQGSAREERHTTGVRFFGEHGPWDFNHEAIYQFGRFGNGTIGAWTVATDHGYTFQSIAGKPRMGIKAAVASGDPDTDDSRLATFNPLYPRGNYFTEAALLGPQNFMDLRPGVSVQVTEDVTLDLGTDFYWRHRTEDGVYRPSGSLIYQGNESSARFVGTDLSLSAEWRATPHFTVSGAYTHFFAGKFIREAGGADVDYGSVWITCRF